MNKNRIPNCEYCGKPLDPRVDTDAETGGFWHAHFATCVHPVVDGRFAVVSPEGKVVARYTTLKRAQVQVEYYTQWNPGSTFKVVPNV